MDIIYQVSLEGDDGSLVHVGDLAATGQLCQFRYSEAFQHPRQFSLDPIHLVYGERLYEMQRILFGVFEDSLPDGWGRALMAKRFNLSHAEQSPHLLLQYLNDQSLGALRYQASGIEAANVRDSESLHSLADLARAAQAFEKGELHDDEMLERLFNSAGSQGGAHPKVNVEDGDEQAYIVKLPSITDKYDAIGLEAACLHLAEEVGMCVAPFEVIEMGGIKMLRLNRFDRTDAGSLHMISMQSLLNVSGYYYASYVQMADAIRMVSHKPSQDLVALFRQMIFNAVIGNTDDHLKNFSMYYRGGFELTPAYDLLPDVNQKNAHTLSFLDNDVGPRRSEAIGSLAGRFKMKKHEAINIVDEVVDVISMRWGSVCSEYDVPQNEIDYFYKYIERQCKKLSASEGKALEQH